MQLAAWRCCGSCAGADHDPCHTWRCGTLCGQLQQFTPCSGPTAGCYCGCCWPLPGLSGRRTYLPYQPCLLHGICIRLTSLLCNSKRSSDYIVHGCPVFAHQRVVPAPDSSRYALVCYALPCFFIEAARTHRSHMKRTYVVLSTAAMSCSLSMHCCSAGMPAEHSSSRHAYAGGRSGASCAGSFCITPPPADLASACA